VDLSQYGETAVMISQKSGDMTAPSQQYKVTPMFTIFSGDGQKCRLFAGLS